MRTHRPPRPLTIYYKILLLFLSLLYITSCSQQELYTLRFRQNLYYFFESSPKPLCTLTARYLARLYNYSYLGYVILIFRLLSISQLRPSIPIVIQSKIIILAQLQVEYRYKQLCVYTRNLFRAGQCNNYIIALYRIYYFA